MSMTSTAYYTNPDSITIDKRKPDVAGNPAYVTLCFEGIHAESRCRIMLKDLAQADELVTKIKVATEELRKEIECP